MKKDEMDFKLKNAFNALQNIPGRDPQAAARGRANFLKQAAVLRQSASRETDRRQSWWSSKIFPVLQARPRLPVMNTLMAVVLAVVVFFGGSAVTVYAAQDSLPDQALYPVKTWSEEARLVLTGSAQMRLKHVLDFSDRRVTEMGGLLAAEKPIPQGVETRLQDELDLALELVAGMDDSQAIQQLEQVRQRAEAQYQKMERLVAGAPESAQPLLLRSRACLQEQIRLASLGGQDLQEFRMQIRQRFQNQLGGNQSTGTPSPYGAGPGGNQSTRTPGPHGPGPGGNQPAATPGQYGPGAASPTGTPMPAGTSYGPGPEGNQPSGTPGQYGPGATSPACTATPAGTSSGPGPGGNQPSGTPGQSGPGAASPTGTPVPDGTSSGPGPGGNQPTTTPGQ